MGWSGESHPLGYSLSPTTTCRRMSLRKSEQPRFFYFLGNINHITALSLFALVTGELKGKFAIEIQ